MTEYLDDLKYDVMGDNYQESYEYQDHEEYTADYADHDYPEYDYGELHDEDGYGKDNCYDTEKNCDGVCPDKHIEIRYVYVPGDAGPQGP